VRDEWTPGDGILPERTRWRRDWQLNFWCNFFQVSSICAISIPTHRNDHARPDGTFGARHERGKDFFVWIRRNPLKRPDSAKGIQEIQSLFPWISLDLFGANTVLYT
jgi:hypothetical protein